MKAPVTVMFYRRPDHLRQVMATIREVRPELLFGVSDGPKEGNPEVFQGVLESRKVFRETIDWPCQWKLLERPTNLGVRRSVDQGLDWVFKQVEETIILEDDTVPDRAFFLFAAELLEKYRNVPKIGSINGSCHDDPADWLSADSYRFSRYHHSWGWATWRRAWQFYDRKQTLLERSKDRNWRKLQGLTQREWAYWDRNFSYAYGGRLDTWDYQWTLSLWDRQMATILPRTNLVRNIGFDSLGTNTTDSNWTQGVTQKVRPLSFPLRHPEGIEIDVTKDRNVFLRHYVKLEGRRNLWEKIRDACRRIFRGRFS